MSIFVLYTRLVIFGFKQNILTILVCICMCGLRVFDINYICELSLLKLNCSQILCSRRYNSTLTIQVIQFSSILHMVPIEAIDIASIENLVFCFFLLPLISLGKEKQEKLTIIYYPFVFRCDLI